MPYPKVKISDDDGNTVDITENNELKVKLSDSVTVTADELEVHLTAITDDVLIYGNDGSDNQKIKTYTDGKLRIYDINETVTVGGSVSVNTVDISTLATHEKQLGAGHTVDCDDSDVNVTNMISGFATSGSQLADDHNVTVSNIADAKITGFATSGSQLAAGHTIDCDDSDVNVTNMISGFATSGAQLAAGHTVDCDGSDVTVDNAQDDAVYARITDGSGGVVNVTPNGELEVRIETIDSSAGTMSVKQAIVSTATNTKVSVGILTTQIVDNIPGRYSIDIVNDSDEIVYLGLEDDAVLNEGIRLNPNGGSYSSNIFTGIINGIAAKTANVTVAYTYVSS